MDIEADPVIKKARLHRKVATAIFFESNGGQSNTEATVPEIRLAVAEPDLEIANLETVLENLRSECYYLTVNQTRYKFGIYPNLNKLLADRRANISGDRIEQRLQTEIRKIFTSPQGLQVNRVHLSFAISIYLAINICTQKNWLRSKVWWCS